MLFKKRQIKDILMSDYRPFGIFPHRWKFKGPWQRRHKYPWLNALITPRSLYRLQYFNGDRHERRVWFRKRNKAYRTFISITKHKHERVKLKFGTNGGDRSVHYKLNLLKVIAPFYGKLNNKQFRNIWKHYKYIKTPCQGRAGKHMSQLNTSLYILVHHLNWAPNTWWAQQIIRNGWIYISSVRKETKQTLTVEKFPLWPIKLPINLHTIPQQNNIQTLNPFINLRWNEIIQIHPYIKNYMNQFFWRKWQRKRLPRYLEVNSNSTCALLVKSPIYPSVNRKERNKKTFLRFLMH
jgi:hypothetical protein